MAHNCVVGTWTLVVLGLCCKTTVGASVLETGDSIASMDAAVCRQAGGRARMSPQCKPHSTPTGGCRRSDRSRLAWPERFEASQLRGPRMACLAACWFEASLKPCSGRLWPLGHPKAKEFCWFVFPVSMRAFSHALSKPSKPYLQGLHANFGCASHDTCSTTRR